MAKNAKKFKENEIKEPLMEIAMTRESYRYGRETKYYNDACYYARHATVSSDGVEKCYRDAYAGSYGYTKGAREKRHDAYR